MKKMMTVMMMLVMMFSFSLTVNAEVSPKGESTTEQNATVVPPSQETASPKTGESDIVLYGLGMTAVVLASGAVVLRKKAM